MTTGASLKPASASSMPDSRLGSGTLRSTAKTAAASVEVTMAPTSSEIVHDSGRSVCAATATTTTETATPTVESSAAGATEPLMLSHDVVRPPSARMSTRAAYPSTRVMEASSNAMPSPALPSASPMPR